MIKFLSGYTTPSLLAWAQIQLINDLNKRGIKATLYGQNPWPSSFCNYKKLHDFKLQRGDKIYCLGLPIDHYWELINPEFSLFTHGRKQRLINLTIYFFKTFISILSLNVFYKFNKISIINQHFEFKTQFSTLPELEKIKLSPSQEMTNSLLMSDFDTLNNSFIYADDILPEHDAKSALERALHENKKVYLTGNILDPLYFAQEILPLCQTFQGQIAFLGPSENFFTHLSKIETKLYATK